MKQFVNFFFSIIASSFLVGQGEVMLLNPDRVFDGSEIRENAVVVIENDRIVFVGSAEEFEYQGEVLRFDLSGTTLLPGLIEGHSHVLLHPYNETSWNDQVLRESVAERSVRGAIHLKKTIEAGFTTIRDLGSEGAGYADVGLKQAVEKGIIPGPRMIVAGKAIVTTGSYGPKGFAENVDVPLGAEVADGYGDLTKVVRDQIGKGADFIKVYADYRWGPDGEAMPTFTLDELRLIVSIAESSGRYVVAHAASPEGMRRAVLAGVRSIEHGDGGTREIFKLMRENEVALCPTLAAGDAIAQYSGWVKGRDPDPVRISRKKKSFAIALEEEVQICAGGDVGVFPHGDNVRELELMSEYGMSEKDILKSVTSSNARVLGLENQIGKIQEGFLADILVVSGNPLADISTLRNIRLVLKGGQILVKNP